MERRGKWQAIRELGRGGQGITFLAVDTTQHNQEELGNLVATTIVRLGGILPADHRPILVQNLATALKPFMFGPDERCLGALKILHSPTDASGLDKAKARMASEVRIYEAVHHPNFLHTLEHDVENGWLVTDYQTGGTLNNHLDRYKGDLLGALLAIRPLIDAVLEIHRRGAVHRDIKPDNIYLGRRGELILGDAGLVFFVDEKHSRISDPLENVGSRDWMPGWATGMRVEDIKPNFDVFSLGKVIWSMVSGRPRLRLWYHHDPEFELEAMFPEDFSMRWARFVLDPCIVERQGDCLRTSRELLDRVDWAIRGLRAGAQVIGNEMNFRCRTCGLGVCQLIVNERFEPTRNFGLQPTGTRAFKIFSCNYCGHTELFHIENPDARPRAWPGKPADRR